MAGIPSAKETMSGTIRITLSDMINPLNIPRGQPVVMGIPDIA
jgi:hypothetical protein